MKNVKNNNIEVDSEDTINIFAVLSRYLNYWKLALLIIALSLITGVGYIYFSQKKYLSTTSILLIEDSGKGKSAGGFDLESIGMLSTTNNIDNEITILKSPDLMLQVVNDLAIHYQYSNKDKFRELNIYKTSPYIAKLENDSILETCYIEASVALNNGSYNVSGFYRKVGNKHLFSESSSTLPININISGVNLNIASNGATEQGNKNSDNVYIKIYNPIAAADTYSDILNISTATKYSSVLNLQINTSNPQMGKEILSKLIEAYNIDNIKDKNRMAINTASFINERIKDISIELGDVEKDVEHYKQSQGITNLGSESQLYMQQTALNTEKQVEIETQLKIAAMIEEFIKNPANKEKTIPNIGLTDPGLVSSITEYNGRLLGYASILTSSGKENPTRLRAQTELTTSRESILNLVKNVKQSMQITKQNIEKQLSVNSIKIHSLPMQERGLLEKMRQQQIKENLYLFLLQKREETNITMAATSNKAKTIINPRSLGSPVSPDKKIIGLAAIIIGLTLSVIIIYILLLLRNKIESREDLEKISDAPILGIITKCENLSSKIVIQKSSNTPVAELFRYLRNRIEFVLEDHQKSILVTSTIAGEGKTFVAVNLACSFALNDKKVLLIGMDVRNPQLANTMEFGKGAGLTDYISGNKKDWRDLLLSPLKDNPNLVVLQAGTIPPNPNELLKSKLVTQLMEEARAEYDIIVLDSAPLGLISDTYELSKHSDFTLYVARENVTHKSAISFANNQYNEKHFSNMYIVLNDASLDSAKSYRYGYTNTYGYQQDK